MLKHANEIIWYDAKMREHSQINANRIYDKVVLKSVSNRKQMQRGYLVMRLQSNAKRLLINVNVSIN